MRGVSPSVHNRDGTDSKLMGSYSEMNSRTHLEVRQIGVSFVDIHLLMQQVQQQGDMILSRLPPGEVALTNASPTEVAVTASESDTSVIAGMEDCLATSSPAPAQTFNVFAAYRNTDSPCDEECNCWCHSAAEQRTRWSTPPVLRSIVGMWLASYTTSLSWARDCSVQTCRRNPSSTYEVQYEFPRWLTTWTAHALIQKRLAEPPTATLRFRPRVKFGSSVQRIILSHDPFAVREFLAAHPHCVDTRLDEGGTSPLICLILVRRRFSVESWISVLEMMIQAGANLYEDDDRGISAAKLLAISCIKGTLPSSLVTRLSTLLPMSQIMSELNLSPITKILLNTQVGDIRTSLYSRPKWELAIDELDGYGQAPLHWAIQRGNLYAVEQLIAYGANVNLGAITSFTPLMLISGSMFGPKERVDCAGMLIKAGADVNAVNRAGRSALHVACRSNKSADLVRFLLRLTDVVPGTDGLPPIHLVEDPAALECLLAYGYDINVLNQNGWSCLMVSIKNGTCRNCRLLLAYGTDYTTVSHEGWTVLHIAARQAHLMVMEVLHHHGLAGVDPDALDVWGLSAEDHFRHRDWKSASEVAAFGRLMCRVRETYHAWRTDHEKRLEETECATASEDDDRGSEAETDSEDEFEDARETPLVEELGRTSADVV